MTTLQRNSTWRLANSLWIGWTFTLLFNWAAFLHIGARARKKRWYVWGLLYTLPLVVVRALWLPLIESQRLPAYQLIALGVIAIFGVIAIIHAFVANNAYLQSLEAMPSPTFTSHSRAWEIAHSLWIYVLCAGFALTLFNVQMFLPEWIPLWYPINGIVFTYLGLRTGQRKWIFWGLLYCLPFMAEVVVLNTFDWQIARLMRPEQFFQHFAFLWLVDVFVLPVYAISAMHAFAAQREYLLRRAGEWPDSTAPRVVTPSLAQAGNRPVAPLRPLRPLPVGRAVDINNAGAAEIATLPGVNMIMALKAVEIRRQRGAFSSAQHFASAIGLKPLVADRIRPQVHIAPVRAAPPPPIPPHRRTVRLGERQIDA